MTRLRALFAAQAALLLLSATECQKLDQACEMLIAFDEPLFRHYNQDLNRIKDLAREEVKLLNDIYHRTLLQKGSRFGHIYFRIKEVRVLFDFCVDCNHTQDVFLHEFSKLDTTSFCLAHLFTFRDFPDGLQGLAWKSQVCRKQYNTGFTTLLNHKVNWKHFCSLRTFQMCENKGKKLHCGGCVNCNFKMSFLLQVQSTVEQSAMTFSHEIGHNLGADHDEELDCPSGFIMSEQGSRSSSLSFSHCSLTNMSSELDHVLSKPYLNCFTSKDFDYQRDVFSICGNGIVEGEEECDCGIEYQYCEDPCCYAAHIDPWDVWLNDSAIPCRTNLKPTCLDPLRSIRHYGLIAPWIFIASTMFTLSIILLWDWKHKRYLYTHLKPKMPKSPSAPEARPRSADGTKTTQPLPNQEVTPSSPFLQWPTSTTEPWSTSTSKKGPAPPPPPLSVPFSQQILSDTCQTEEIDLVPRRRAPPPPPPAYELSGPTSPLPVHHGNVSSVRKMFESK